MDGQDLPRCKNDRRQTVGLENLQKGTEAVFMQDRVLSSRNDFSVSSEPNPQHDSVVRQSGRSVKKRSWGFCPWLAALVVMAIGSWLVSADIKIKAADNTNVLL